jgi:hypothetical protein
MLGIVLLVVLVILIIGVLPTWGYSSPYGYGYYPSGILGVVLVIILILVLLGHV